MTLPGFGRSSWTVRSFVPSALFVAVVLLSAMPSIALAQSTGTGSVSGSVSNAATQKVLERAVVSVAGTNLSTVTYPDGRFRLVGVPAGEQRLVVSYTGLEDSTQTVSVKAGETVNADIALKSQSEVIKLDTITVSAEPEGNAYAIQQQKMAESQRNVVSADAFGVISDANPGEFLKMMPGIQMDYTGIEPRGLMVRGMAPNDNLVMINGNQAASASSSSTNRQFEFDQITIDNIESIEVYKAAIPSMPANSIGGTVNMITRSAFLQKGRRLNATLNLTANGDNLSTAKTSGPNDVPTRKMHPGGSLTYSNSFMDGRLGVVVSVSQVNVNGFGGTAYNTYTSNASGTYVSSYQREDHQNYTERSGASVNLDYKVSDATTVFLRTTFTDHYYEFRNRFLRINTGTIVGTATPSRVETTGGNSDQNMSFGNKHNDSQTINLGAKHRFDNWTIEYDAASSVANNKYTYLPWMFGGVTATNSGISYVLEKDPSRAYATKFTQTGGGDVYNLGNGNHRIAANGISASFRDSKDDITSLKGKVRRDFAAKFPFYVEGGVSFQKQERNRQNPSKRWNYVGPDGIAGTADDTTGANLQQFAEQEYTPNLWFGERAPNAWISPFQLAKLFTQAPGAFVEDVGNTYDQAFRSKQSFAETIKAAYLMANVKFDKLTVLFGTRIEDTSVSGSGAKQNNALAAGLPVGSLAYHIARLSRTTVSTGYTSSPFKYLHLTYEFDKKLQARASYSEAISRPNLSDILPGISVGTTSVSVANTALKPERAQNMDLSLEWYPGKTSVFSAAWFSKDRKDYVINDSFLIPNGGIPSLDIGPELAGLTATTKRNGGDVMIKGYELNGRYQLTFLPTWLKRLEVFGNYTKLYSTTGTPTVNGRLTTLAPEVWNAGFNYTTPDGKFFFKLLANFVDDSLINTATGELKDARTVLDAEIRYNMTSRYTLSLAGRNVSSALEGQHLPDGRATRTGTGGGTALTLTLSGRF